MAERRRRSGFRPARRLTEQVVSGGATAPRHVPQPKPLLRCGAPQDGSDNAPLRR